METPAVIRIREQLSFITKSRDSLIIDCDTHLSDTSNLYGDIATKYHNSANLYQGRPISVDDLIKEMNMAGVDMAVCWQNPAATFMPGGDANFSALYAANEYIYNCSCQYPDRIIPAGWTDPVKLGYEGAVEMARICVQKFGFPIVKFNPAQNEYNIDNDVVFRLIKEIHALGAVPAFHMAADTPYTPTEGLIKIVDTFTEAPLLAVHMGGGGSSYMEAESMYIKLRDMGLCHPNLFFIESAKRDIHIESDFITYALNSDEAWKRIFCGSDAPYGRMTWNYGGYRLMFDSLINSSNHTDVRVRENANVFTPELAKAFLGTNFANFIIDIYQKLLAK